MLCLINQKTLLRGSTLFLFSKKSKAIFYKDKAFTILSMILSFLSVLIIGTIVYYLFSESYSFFDHVGLSSILNFNSDWFPLEGKYSFFPMLITSLSLGIGASFIVILTSLSLGIFKKFLIKKRFASVIFQIISLANAIPSVVYGFWGISVVVPFMTKFHFIGTHLLSGIIVLSFMLIPTATLLFFRAVDAWPRYIEESSRSLGLSLTTKIVKIYFPLLLKETPVILLLTFTRAVGETIAVVMVTGNIVKIPESLFSSVRALTSNIALEMAYATGPHREALFFTGALLLLIVFSVLVVIKIFRIGGNYAFKK